MGTIRAVAEWLIFRWPSCRNPCVDFFEEMAEVDG
jgi:hypothetical protein